MAMAGSFSLISVPKSPTRSVSAIEHGYCAIIAGPNFGCGSSREAAVYALVDAGVRAVIAPSFGDIFFANAANNGLLALRLQPEAIAILKQLPAGQQATIDLQARQILADDLDLKFEVEEAIRAKLLNGWDDLDLTLSHEDAIAAWHQADLDRRPWAAGPANNPTIGPLA